MSAPLAERSAVRDAAVRAMLPLAAAEGWTWATIRAGLAASGADPAWPGAISPAGRSTPS